MARDGITGDANVRPVSAVVEHDAASDDGMRRRKTRRDGSSMCGMEGLTGRPDCGAGDGNWMRGRCDA